MNSDVSYLTTSGADNVRLTRKLAVIASMVLTCSGAPAGTVVIVPVEVTVYPEGGGSASGSMGAARFSTQPLELISCTAGVIALDDQAYIPWARCIARTGSNGIGFCYTEHPALVEVVHSISDYSLISFTWDANESCQTISIGTKSQLIP